VSVYKAWSCLMYLDHLERNGSGLYAKACALDLKGIVAKWKDGSYIADNRRSSWVKIKNPQYSQIEGREELFGQCLVALKAFQEFLLGQGGLRHGSARFVRAVTL
jgi:hypothetical protein